MVFLIGQVSGSLIPVTSLEQSFPSVCLIQLDEFCFILLYVIIIYCYLLQDCSFLMKDKKWKGSGGDGKRRGSGNIRGREYIINTCEKRIYFQ